MNWHDYITVDPKVCHGNACIKNTRIMIDENMPVANSIMGFSPCGL